MPKPDREVVIAQDERKIGIARAQLERDFVGSSLFHLGNRFEQGLARRLGVFTTVVIQRCNHVFRRHRLAVVEFDALA